MVTLKIQVPDAEDKSMIERWRYFFGIKSMSLDYVKLTEKEWERADGTVIRNTVDEVMDDEGKSFASRLYCHRENQESFMVYCNTVVYIIDDGKTIDRINYKTYNIINLRENMTPEQQIEKIQNDIEGILNDFEFGISEKDETIVLLRNYVYERAEIAVKNYKRSLPVEAQVKHANGVYSMNECIFQYCPTPDLCKKENKCLKCRHLNIVKYCKNCNMDIHDETMSDCLVCREKLVTKCEDCLEILD